MRKFVWVHAAVAGLALGLLVPRGSSAPALPDRPVKWEYGELRYSVRYVPVPGPAGMGGRQTVPEVTVRWTIADQEVEGSGWDSLAGKLKAPAGKGEASALAHKLRVLDRLGADGWEVYAQAGSEVSNTYATWSLRRRAP